MARAEFMLDEDFAIKLSKYETDMDFVAKEAIFEGAKIAADQVSANLDGVLSGDSTGQMAESFGITPILKSGGEWSAHVGFDGYDDQGVANQLKARGIESGTEFRPKKPFVRPAINQTKKQIQKKMQEVIEERTKEIFG
ncbi:HK97-gp10 family putative phage morphogenesis protein [Acetobacterium wieringae]|uniref:HK97-gp10 family putative phage morphogenesis protein n=1 Tax=Acetobacterium wieringae TaxID=52694 RepID=UPI0031598521